jgi:hypothetical protein
MLNHLDVKTIKNEFFLQVSYNYIILYIVQIEVDS